LVQHISRKELKKDEIREGLAHGAEAVVSHQQLLRTVGGIALVVVLAVAGWRFYTQRQTVKAAADLDAAMKIYQAQIRDANTPPEQTLPGEVTYQNPITKYTDAEKQFAAISARYPHTRPGLEARYYDALCDVQLNRNDQGERELKALAAGSDQDFSGLAQYQLALLYDKTGRGPQAAQVYQQLVNKPPLLVPKALVLLSLADHYSKSDPTQAAKLYNQIKQDYPDSQAAQQADQHLQLLSAKS
jgi:tetratricopeptide (TPR) repeat protein